MDRRTYAELEGMHLLSNAIRTLTTEATKLTALADSVWLGATVVYWRANEDVPVMEPGGRHYQLERAAITERPPVYLGDCKEAAESKLRTLMEAADLDAIAEQLAADLKAMKPGEKRYIGTGKCQVPMRRTRNGRYRLTVRGDELRERLHAALGPGWSYTKRGAWWDPPDP